MRLIFMMKIAMKYRHNADQDFTGSEKFSELLIIAHYPHQVEINAHQMIIIIFETNEQKKWFFFLSFF